MRDLLTETLKEVNNRLRMMGHRITLRRVKESLYIRITEPSGRRTEQSTKLKATPANCFKAEQLALRVVMELETNTFIPKGNTIEYWVAKFEQDYWNRRPKNSVSLHTWKNDYAYLYSLFPEGTVLTTEAAVTAINQTVPDSRKRQSAVRAITALCKFAGIPGDFKYLRGNYSPKDRYIPEDSEICDVWCRLQSTPWHWVYGVIAAFGLRNHEVFYLDTSGILDGFVRVNEGKTGSRIAAAFHPHWVQDWGLHHVLLPDVHCESHYNYGKRVSQAFKYYEVGHEPYALRHAHAARMVSYNVPDAVAARYHGHSAVVHTKVYQRHIGDDFLKQEYLKYKR